MKSLEITLNFSNGAFHAVDREIYQFALLQRRELLDIELFKDNTCVLFYQLSGQNLEQLKQKLSNHNEVISINALTYEKRHYLLIHVTEGEPLSTLLNIVENHTVILRRPLSFTESGCLQVKLIGTEEALRNALKEGLEEVDITIDRFSVFTPGKKGILSVLTERQLEALRTAVQLGYFEEPRQAKYGDIAEELDCATTTCNTLIRKAENKIFKYLLTKYNV